MKRAAALAAFLLMGGCGHAPFDSQPMPSVELDRYMGRWYEIARYPNSFEKGCHGVTADYALQEDRTVAVVNTCRKDGPKGPVRSARARAWSVDPSNSRLKVSFFRPFSAPYWIVALDPEYRWAMVGHPERKYLWVLSRTPALDPSVDAGVMAEVARLGYDPARLERPEQAPQGDKEPTP
ncbi:MAG: lipocalin family protein [Elusimicrobiota bacterium]|jgi:apolipoprotein D and lipocalin family protein